MPAPFATPNQPASPPNPGEGKSVSLQETFDTATKAEWAAIEVLANASRARKEAEEALEASKKPVEAAK